MYLTSEGILNVALTIERKAIDFYTRLGHRLDDRLARDLLREEKQHIRLFKKIFDGRSGVLGRQSFENPFMDDAMMAATFAEIDVFRDLDPETVRADHVIDAAITIEDNAIRFYSELIRVVDAESPEAKALLQDMLLEEHRHKRLLVERKKKL